MKEIETVPEIKIPTLDDDLLHFWPDGIHATIGKSVALCGVVKETPRIGGKGKHCPICESMSREWV